MMPEFNSDAVFEPILASIESGEIKTTHSLRLILDSLSEKYKISSLKLLVAFRQWLLLRGIELSTTDGVVTLGEPE